MSRATQGGSGGDADRHLRADYPSSTLTPAVVRHQVMRTLDGWFDGDLGPLPDEAALVASELATNCVQAGAHWIGLGLDADGSGLRVSLVDDVPADPVRRTAGLSDSHGRGLAIVAALSRDWGIDRHDGSKTVWADMDVPSTAVDRAAG